MIATKYDIQLCAEDSWYFISNFVQTFDEHDPSNPVKPFPRWDELFMYAAKACDEAMRSNQPGAVVKAFPKSRQIMASWFFSAWCLKQAMFNERISVVVQSKKQEDSEYQITRFKHIYTHLPQIFIDRFPLSRPMSRQNKSGLDFLNGSKVSAAPSGGHAVRSRVPTIYWSDEFAFQDEAEESFGAGFACSKLILLVSSANPGYFQRLVEDTDGDGESNLANLGILSEGRDFGMGKIEVGDDEDVGGITDRRFRRRRYAGSSAGYTELDN